MKEDPPLSAKCRDKFLVLGIKISNDVMALEGDALQASLLALWAQADTAKAATNGAVNGATNGSDGTDGTAAAALHNPIVERKLRCSFLPPAHSPSPSMLPSTATPLVDPTTAKSDFHDARETVSVGGVLASEGLRSNYPVQSASASTIVGSTLEQDLTDAREKIHSLQSACEAYKIEIERISQVRLRRAEASGHSLTTDSTAVNGLAATRVKKDTISLTMLITAVLIAFLAGIYLF
ncbi:hypothetical protein BSLG_009746 [Batrachochytrium salamandrivorans]|nr:hypothetical protein BSLG_009746 [Batrachochytrium salamandrivorans]